MPEKIYRVRLADEEREGLKSLTNKGRASARKQTHARILLLCDEGREGGGRTDAEIADALGVGSATVARVRRRCVEEGVEAALERKPQRNRRAKVLDGEAEARLVAVACGEPPAGRANRQHSVSPSRTSFPGSSNTHPRIRPPRWLSTSTSTPPRSTSVVTHHRFVVHPPLSRTACVARHGIVKIIRLSTLNEGP